MSSIYGDAVLDFDPRHSEDRNADSDRVQQQLIQLKSLFPNTGKMYWSAKEKIVFVFVFDDSWPMIVIG